MSRIPHFSLIGARGKKEEIKVTIEVVFFASSGERRSLEESTSWLHTSD